MYIILLAAYSITLVATIVWPVRYWLPLVILTLILTVIFIDDAINAAIPAIIVTPIIWIGLWIKSIIDKQQAKRRQSTAAIQTEHPRKGTNQAVSTKPDMQSPPAENHSKSSAPMIEEPVTAALRRQVPVCFDKKPKSWLGGLPCMPDNIPWPTAACHTHPEKGQVYLHFAAQIACEDLPKKLWGGLGPRHGWLLFFLDAQGLNYGDYEKNQTFQVIHIEKLGPERPLPDEIYALHNNDYTDYSFQYYRSKDQLPKKWRKWPVDIVELPNILNPDLPGELDESEITEPVTRMTSEALYNGQTVDHEKPHFTKDVISDVKYWPFSWGGALAVVDTIERTIRDNGAPELNNSYAEFLDDPVWFSSLAENLAAGIEEKDLQLKDLSKSLEDQNQSESKLERIRWTMPNIQKERGEVADALEIIKKCATPEELQQAFSNSEAKLVEWYDTRLTMLEELRTAIQKHDMDSSISTDEFRPFFDRISETCDLLLIRRSHNETPSLVLNQKHSLLGKAAKGFEAARYDIAAGLSAKSAKAKAIVPEDILTEYEPKWRHLLNNRPHRMGGYPDPIQSEEGDYPRDYVLLFQLASDDVMQWSWGGGGAIYVTIDTQSLKDADFSKIKGWYER